LFEPTADRESAAPAAPSGDSELPPGEASHHAAHWSTIALLVGLGVGGAMLGSWWLLARGQADPPLPWLWPVALPVGLAVLAGGVLAYGLLPAFWRREAASVRELIGSYGGALIDLLTVVLLAAPLTALGLAGLRWLGLEPASIEDGRIRLRPEGLLLAVVMTDVPMVLLVLGRVVGSGAASWRDLGLRWRGAGDVQLGLMSGVGILVLVAVVSALLRFGAGVTNPQAELFEVQGISAGGFALALLGAAVFAPVVEELFFRGYLFGQLARRKGAAAAYAVSAGLFAIVHVNLPARGADVVNQLGPTLLLLIPFFLVGLVLARLYHATGSLVPGIVAHAVNNATAFSVLFLGMARQG